VIFPELPPLAVVHVSVALSPTFTEADTTLNRPPEEAKGPDGNAQVTPAIVIPEESSAVTWPDAVTVDPPDVSPVAHAIEKLWADEFPPVLVDVEDDVTLEEPPTEVVVVTLEEDPGWPDVPEAPAAIKACLIARSTPPRHEIVTRSPMEKPPVSANPFGPTLQSQCPTWICEWLSAVTFPVAVQCGTARRAAPADPPINKIPPTTNGMTSRPAVIAP
jgi:hypothetical protein